MNIFDQIKEKIKEKINPENLVLIDNSRLHTKHKSFDPNKFHIKLIIKSEKLKNMGRIQSNKLIFKILDNEMKKYIHSLQIFFL